MCACMLEKEAEGIKDRQLEKETGGGRERQHELELKLAVAVILYFTFSHPFDLQCSAEQV